MRGDVPRGLAPHPPAPADPAELAGFPSRSVDGVWCRAHAHYDGADRGMWNYSSVGSDSNTSGRFDLPSPRGTCYLANTDEVAVRERLGTQLVKRGGKESVLETVLTANRKPVLVTRAHVNRPTVANLAVKGAEKWVTQALTAGTEYAVSQAWARVFDAARFDGLAYRPRFVTNAQARSLALFSDAGQPDPAPPVGTCEPIRAVLQRLRVRIVAVPAKAPETLGATTAPPPL